MSHRNLINTEINVVFRSKLPSLIHFDNTRIETSTSKKWSEVLHQHNIPFEHKTMELIKRGTGQDEPLDYNGTIASFLKRFRRNQDTYNVYIEKITAKKQRQRDRIQQAAARASTSTPGGSRINQGTPRKRGIIAPTPLPTFVNIGDLGMGLGLNEATIGVPIGGQRPNPFKREGRFPIRENPILRDEDTQEGNNVRDGEENVHEAIKGYINTRWSNRDILEMRKELNTLIEQEQFHALIRLAPLTSGYLRTAFLDKH